MKFFTLLFLLMAITCSWLPAQTDTTSFITTWNTMNPGASEDGYIRIPTNGTLNYNYDIDVDNDGIFDLFNITGDTTLALGEEGDSLQTIRIRGDFPAIFFANQGDKEKLITVEQWGSIEWKTFDRAFLGCSNLQITAVDAPDLSQVSRMSAAFAGCTSLNADINHWDVSQVTEMEGTFQMAISFNQPLDQWQVGQVTNMNSLFSFCDSFNQPLNSWDVSQVNFMAGLFYQATAFNQPLDAWNTDNVIIMNAMFEEAISFDQDLSDWDISRVLTMENMFRGSQLSTPNYDAILQGWSTLSEEETTIPTQVRFHGGQSSYCTAGAERHYLIKQLGWIITDNGSDCLDLRLTEVLVEAQNDPQAQAGEWVELYNAGPVAWTDSIDGRLFLSPGLPGPWPPTDIIGIDRLEPGQRAILLLSEDGSYGPDQFTDIWNPVVDLREVPLGQVHGSGLFSSGGQLALMLGAPTFNGIIDTLTYPAIGTNYSRSWDAELRTFSEADNSSGAVVTAEGGTMVIPYTGSPGNRGRSSHFVTTWDTNLSGPAGNGKIQLNVALNQTFDYDVDLNNDGVFDKFGLKGNFAHDYGQAGVYTIRIRGLFPGLYSSQNPAKEKLVAIEQWGTNPWLTMWSAFLGCANMVINASDAPDLSRVENMGLAFGYCTRFNDELNHWDVSNVESLLHTFFNATSFNQPLDNWNTANVRDMGGIFLGAASFDQDLSAWDISSVFRMLSMFEETALSTANYDATLKGWSTLDPGETAIPTQLLLENKKTSYCTAAAARRRLVRDYGWIIKDAGNECMDLLLTEVFPGQEGSDLTADWIEIYNRGTMTWRDTIDGPLFLSFDTSLVQPPLPIKGIHELAPGERAVALITLDSLADLATFTEVWGKVADLADLPLGIVPTEDLPETGDTLFLVMDDPEYLPGQVMDTLSYPDIQEWDGHSWDAELGSFSEAGNNSGAVVTINFGGINGDVPNIASPGNRSAIVGIKNIREFDQLKVFPNPTQATLTVDAGQNGQLSVFDAWGRRMIQQNLHDQGRLQVDLSDLPSGWYVVQVLGKDIRAMARVFKQ